MTMGDTVSLSPAVAQMLTVDQPVRAVVDLR
jgi:hypothetical protein